MFTWYLVLRHQYLRLDSQKPVCVTILSLIESSADAHYVRSAGKWNKHVDAWDSIEDNEFFSLEGFRFAFGQMISVSLPPNRYTPEFQIYKKYKDFEIRRYVRMLHHLPLESQKAAILRM